MNLAAETHLKGGHDTGVEAVPSAGVGGGPLDQYLPTVPIHRFLSTFTPLSVAEISSFSLRSQISYNQISLASFLILPPCGIIL